MEENKTSTHYANQLNSTKFTDCCGVAVTYRDNECPVCKKEVKKIEGNHE